MREKPRILIVDDEPMNLDFFGLMLSKLGFVIEKAEDGEEALEKVKSFNPDLVILDNIMPKLTGWQVTRLLKQNEDFKEHKNTPIIMFSAMDDVKDKIEGFELGIDDYITKPYNFSEVLARIRAVLRGRELFKQVRQREKKIALTETFATAALKQIDDLKKPYERIKELCDSADMLSAAAIAEIASAADVVNNGLEILEKELRALDMDSVAFKKGAAALDELDDHFKKHLVHLTESEELSP